MEYYVKETHQYSSLQNTAGIKARDDLEAIFRNKGITEFVINSCIDKREELDKKNKIYAHIKVWKCWKKRCEKLSSGDVLYIQFPVVEHTLFLSNVINKLNKKGIKIVIFIHDLEILRDVKRKDKGVSEKARNYLEETRALKKASYVVSHNYAMKEIIKRYGIHENRILNLRLFDYLIDNYEERIKQVNKDIHAKELPVAIAGNMRQHKARYVYNLPSHIQFNLYGVDYCGPQTDSIKYFGAFSPDDLPFIMTGSFGLVWDGDSVDTCAGAYGEYLQVNNPHKTSLYLASGMPVIIWKKAALSEFIVRNNVGFTIDTIAEIPDRLNSITIKDYNEMLHNAKALSEKIRTGVFTKRIIDEVRKRRIGQ